MHITCITVLLSPATWDICRWKQACATIFPFFPIFCLSLPTTAGHDGRPASLQHTRVSLCLLLRSYCHCLTFAVAGMKETDAAFHCRGMLSRLLEQSVPWLSRPGACLGKTSGAGSAGTGAASASLSPGIRKTQKEGFCLCPSSWKGWGEHDRKVYAQTSTNRSSLNIGKDAWPLGLMPPADSGLG